MTNIVRKKIITYTGNNIILEDIILDDPVVIEAGTKFIMHPNVSIVFRNKVIAHGKKRPSNYLHPL